MDIASKARQMKLDAPKLAACTLEQRNHALKLIASALDEHRDEIFKANAQDLAAAFDANLATSVVKRLNFDEVKLSECLAGIKQLCALDDPVGVVELDRELDAGLELKRVSCPIGVIGVIFEARPDALVQIATLCLKSANCAILKGGKETANTNRVLFELIYDAAVLAGLPQGCLFQAEQRAEIDELLACDESVDLLIPRGSNSFVRYIMDNTKIAVMGHSSGICHTYVDCDADLDLCVPIVVDAKVQYAAACNATETLLVHREIAATILPKLAAALEQAGVTLRGSAEVCDYLESCEIMQPEEFSTEYTDLVISVKLVADVAEAVDHINRFGSHHTDCIITENDQSAAYFMQMVDSAGVYCNCSTRFADGFRYGFGAEVGISTGKIHARGPVGLEGLVTYKYCLYGHGQTVADYASGAKQFHFKDLH